MLQSKKYIAARAYFPRGLVQPGKESEKGYRFSSDALLLGCFLESSPGDHLLDLGTGCGAVALSMLCCYPGAGRAPDLHAVGIDIQPEYVAAANANAARLGFGQAFTALHGDIQAPNPATLPIAPSSFDLALANPPYRQRDRGRHPPDPARLLALFEQEETLAAFCRCAAYALKTGGRFGVIFPALRRNDLLAQLSGAGLISVRILHIHAHSDSPARVILVEAVKTEQNQSSIDEQALILHAEPQHGESSPLFSAAARVFCPFLAR